MLTLLANNSSFFPPILDGRKQAGHLFSTVENRRESVNRLSEMLAGNVNKNISPSRFYDQCERVGPIKFTPPQDPHGEPVCPPLWSAMKIGQNLTKLFTYFRHPIFFSPAAQMTTTYKCNLLGDPRDKRFRSFLILCGPGLGPTAPNLVTFGHPSGDQK